MEKLLLLGADSSTRNALKACKKRNVYTIITDYLTPDQNPLKKMSDEYWMINCTEIDELERKCRDEKITAIYAGNHELCLDCTQALTKRLGLPFYASDLSWKVGRDKLLFKKICRECNIPVAKDYALETSVDPEILRTVEYPVIIKPADASSMRGFSVVRKEEDFKAAYDMAMSFSESKRVIVEEFLEGMEFQLTGVAQNGEIKIFCGHNVHKYKVKDEEVMVAAMPFSIEKDPYITDEFINQVCKLAKKLEIRDGVFFFQGIRHKEKACLIEVAARLDGGGLWNVYKMLFNYDLVGYMIDLARGVKPEHDFSKLDYSLKGRCFAEYGMWGKNGVVKEVLGEELVKKDPKIDIVLSRFRPGMEIKETGNMTQMAWYVNFIADSKEELFEKYRFLNNNMRIISDKGEDLVIPYYGYEEIQI